MRAYAAALLSVLLCTQAHAGLPSFTGMVPILWDSHVHSGNGLMFACVSDPGFDPAVGCHSHRWCADAYQEARARGLTALVLSHDVFQLESIAGLAAWKANGPGYTDAYGAFWPTHPDGYPLLVSGGHTTDEVDALWECAEANTIPGEFLAFYGIETNTFSPNAPGCDDPGQPRCGGHKIGIFGTKPDISFVFGTTPGPEWCLDEGEFYDALDLYSDASNPSIAGVAHPTILIATDFWPYSDPDARGGISQAHLDGFEYRSPSREDLDCVDYSTPLASPPMARCGYRQMLAHGYQLAPWRGSDNHLNPGTQWDAFALDARGICLADAITKPAFLQALRAQRCFWAKAGSPRVELEIEGVPMGQLATTDGTLDYAIFVDGNGTDVGGGWELGCGEVTQDGGNGGYTLVASGPCAGGSCQVSGSVSAGFWDWCYARVRRSDTLPVVVTAPVLLPEP